ncbi:Leo1-like protein-domain-containing protein [Zopfochytrium polystomum]|nr:Leo1-like protein-domain-containing protein [Zopfochytrium polystomum]
MSSPLGSDDDDDLFGDTRDLVDDADENERPNSDDDSRGREASPVGARERSESRSDADDGKRDDRRGSVSDEDRRPDHSDGEAKARDISPKRNEIVRDITIADLPRPENNPFVAKLPNFLSIEPRPFDRDEFEEELRDIEELEDVEYLKTQLKLENTIRWRYTSTEDARKDSNARLIRWSDNSFSLLVGDEMFDCPLKSLQSDHQYLVALHENEALMETQARFNYLMMFAPSSTKSLTHQRLKAAMHSRSQMRNKTKLFAKTQDPEHLKKQAEKAHREAMKAQRKLNASRRKKDDFFRDRSQYRSSVRDVRSFDDEEDFEEEDFSDEEREERLRELKRSRPEKRRRDDYSESELEDEASLASEDEVEERRPEPSSDRRRDDRDRGRREEQPSSKHRAPPPAAAPPPLKRRMVVDSDEDE